MTDQAMKKRRTSRVFVLLAVLLALLLLGGGIFAVFWIREAPYRRLNTMLEEPPASLSLAVTTTLEGEALNATYTLENGEGAKRVTYAYEQIAPFLWVKDHYEAPKERILRTEGSMRISNGRVVLLDGTQPNLPLEALTLSRLRFSSRCFTDVVKEQGSFTATVTDPGALFGYTGDATTMQLILTHDDTRVQTLTLTYSNSLGESVWMQYIFVY